MSPCAPRLPQTSEGSARGDELLGRAALDDPARLHHEDPVALHGLGEPVRDDERGPVPDQCGGGDVQAPVPVPVGRGLVQDDQRGIGEIEPAQREMLHGRGPERVTAGSDGGVQPVGQLDRKSVV